MTASRVEIVDAVGCPVDPERLQALVGAVLSAEASSATISVALVDDSTMRALHRDFCGEDCATDVLSFPLDDGGCGGGPDAFDPEAEGPGAEVVVSVDTARREADARGVPFEAELALYVIHGVLHVIGYDDREEASRARMREAEARHLAAAGYAADLFSARPDPGATRKDEDS